MNKLEWAKNEVRLACLAVPDMEPDDYLDEYVDMCYESALKALETLLDARHSGMSIGITMQILNALVDGHPLTPIEDKPNQWERLRVDDGGYTSSQHKRMSSMFKHEYADGRVEYSDIDRYNAYNIHKPDNPYKGGLVNKIIDEMFPIEFPYIPAAKKYKVYCEDFAYSADCGDYDTVTVLYIIQPDGTRKDIYRYFKELPPGKTGYYACWGEISKDEYLNRRAGAK